MKSVLKAAALGMFAYVSLYCNTEQTGLLGTKALPSLLHVCFFCLSVFSQIKWWEAQNEKEKKKGTQRKRGRVHWRLRYCRVIFDWTGVLQMRGKMTPAVPLLVPGPRLLLSCHTAHHLAQHPVGSPRSEKGWKQDSITRRLQIRENQREGLMNWTTAASWKTCCLCVLLIFLWVWFFWFFYLFSTKLFGSILTQTPNYTLRQIVTYKNKSLLRSLLVFNWVILVTAPW